MPRQQPAEGGNPWWRLAKLALLLYLIFLLLAAMAGTIIWLSYRSDLPSLSQLERYEPSLITRVYSDDGRILKEFYKERRILVPLKKMSPYLVNALISTEDRKFYRHWGVDVHRLGGALWADLKRCGTPRAPAPSPSSWPGCFFSAERRSSPGRSRNG